MHMANYLQFVILSALPFQLKRSWETEFDNVFGFCPIAALGVVVGFDVATTGLEVLLELSADYDEKCRLQVHGGITLEITAMTTTI